jgi:hypothetical protein
VFVRPTPGGRELRLPGHLASTGGWPVAHAHVVTYTVRVDGWTRVRVVRISQVDS